MFHNLIHIQILVHNLHYQGEQYWKSDEMDKNWCFAKPEELFAQILMYEDIDAPEVKLLFEILHKQRKLFDINRLELKDWETHTYYDEMRTNYNWFVVLGTQTYLSRLIQVLDKLRSMEKYRRYHYLIPELAFENNYNSQVFHHLDL